MTFRFKIAAAVALALGLALAWGSLPPSSAAENAEVNIPAGSGASGVARALKEAGVIRSTIVFRLACSLGGNTKKLKAGDYEVPKNVGPWEVMDLLVSGRALQHRFLIPEGLSAIQIARLLEEKQLAKADRFMALVKDKAFTAKLGVEAPSLEGWLFPDSYQISKGIPEEAIITMMVMRFHDMVPDSLLDQGAELHLNQRQVLTLASIIEKEARADSERPKVARVFLNRKASKMRLESCATVRYALDKYKGPVLFTDLDVASPYNTYRHAGLPPGPICSPGLKSIEAAVHPAEGDWLFFVVAGNGEHIFSKTFEEHKKAKLRYKRMKRGVVEDQE
jgi:UPF0755 protein